MHRKMKQKRTYIRPNILVVCPKYETNLLNGGSVRSQEGEKYDIIQPGEGGGSEGDDGFIDGDARAFDGAFTLLED
jgi:hypothetical protein